MTLGRSEANLIKVPIPIYNIIIISPDLRVGEM